MSEMQMEINNESIESIESIQDIESLWTLKV